MHKPPPVPLHKIVKGMEREFGISFVAAISGVSKRVIQCASKGGSITNPDHVEALLKAKKRCYGFHPHDVLVMVYEDQGSVSESADILGVELEIVALALACGKCTKVVHTQMQLLAIWEVWKTEIRAANYALASYLERNR